MAYQIAKVQAGKADESDSKTLCEVWITDPTLVDPVVIHHSQSFTDEGWDDSNLQELFAAAVATYPDLPYDAFLAALL